MHRTQPLTAAVLVAGMGCQAQFPSEEGQWAFQDEALNGESHTGYGGEQSVLEDTLVCPSVHWQGDEIDGWDAEALFEACIDQALSEGAEFAEEEGVDCVHLQQPGEVEWSLEPVACEAFEEDAAPVSDRVLFTVVGASDVSAHVDQWAERQALEGLDLQPADVLTEASLVAEGEPFRLLEDAELRLFVRLWDEERQQAVAWRETDGQVEVVATAGEVDLLDEDALATGWVELRMGAGSKAVVKLTVHGETWEAGTLVATPPDELASLDLVVGYLSDGEGEEERIPWAARAVVLDSSGNPVFGAPVEWSTEGTELALEPGLDADLHLPGDDYAWVLDSCTPPSERLPDRAAVLSARYGTLEDSVEMSWTYTSDLDEDEAEWEPDENCASASGCGCSSRGARRSGLTLLGLAAMALGVRRRR